MGCHQKKYQSMLYFKKLKKQYKQKSIDRWNAQSHRRFKTLIT
ncbi:MAG: hypothetical protein [Microvirus sp.]|nr:MAG: hypothetical protein [Microvirus sp.]